VKCIGLNDSRAIPDDEVIGWMLRYRQFGMPLSAEALMRSRELRRWQDEEA
jgi:hypothetical protein